ncbi:hypothetical protein SXCC_00746 [Gluconacetobacter sp. SXCC-1]|nr:hypothetical protein SXCC_00746 [Gluconacetobacter sp. SXCC-1]
MMSVRTVANVSHIIVKKVVIQTDIIYPVFFPQHDVFVKDTM